MDSRRPIRPIMPALGAVPKQLCCVCAAPAWEVHYGVRSCRDCANFFRRAITGHKQYSHRRPIGGTAGLTSHCCRRTCKLCRLIKCYEVGMRAEDIEPSTSQAEMRCFQAAFVDAIVTYNRVQTIQFIFWRWAQDPAQIWTRLQLIPLVDADMARRVMVYFFGEAGVDNRPPEQMQ